MALVKVKICGLNEPKSVRAAIEAGAGFIGFVFYPPSPRYISVELAADLARLIPSNVKIVGLFVDADDETIKRHLASVPLDYLQLHGSESPSRMAEIAAFSNLPLIKAFRIRGEEDFACIDDYNDVADMFLFDAKPPKSVTRLPGGTGHSFDWSLLEGKKFAKPWMLSGGLNPENIAEAVKETGAKLVDTSSGVEDRPGLKNLKLIEDFIANAG